LAKRSSGTVQCSDDQYHSVVDRGLGDFGVAITDALWRRKTEV
jgi:hypothetical protein